MSTRKRLFGALLATLTIAALPGRAHADVANWHKGFSFVSWWYDEYTRSQTIQSLDQLVALKANWIAITPTWYVSSISGNDIYPVYNGNTATDESVRYIIRQAKARGLKVMLKPHVDPKGDWRGNIKPSNTSTWFNSYRNFISHYGQMAQAEGVDMFCIGTELATMTKPANSSQWRSVITTARSVYKGPLTYAANWGTRSWGEYYQIDWWDAMDYIGIDAYFPLTRQLTPSVTAVKNGWFSYIDPWNANLRWVDDIKALANKYGKKVIFTEIGFDSVPNAGDIWYTSATRKADMTAQKNCVEGTFQALDPEPWMAGVFWWTWNTDPNRGGTSDTGMDLNRKPAADTIRAWFSKGGGDSTAPSVPTGVTASAASSTSITVRWNASTDNVGVTGYRVYRDGTRVAQITGTTYSDVNLTASRTYSYRVSAVDAAGNESSQSAAASATTASPADTQKPTVPTGLTASAVSTTAISLRWNASTDNVGVNGYFVFRNGVRVATTATTTYTDSGLTAGTSYSYQVGAYDAAGNTSALCTSVTGKTNSSGTTNPPPTNTGGGSYNFENGTQGWTKMDGCTDIWNDTSPYWKYEGSRSLGLWMTNISNSVHGHAVIQPPANTIVPGKKITAQVMLRSSMTSVIARVWVNDSRGAWLAGPVASLRPNNAWTQVELTIPSTAQGPITRLGIQFLTTSGSYTGFIMVDDVRW